MCPKPEGPYCPLEHVNIEMKLPIQRSEEKGKRHRKKLLFFWILSKLPFPPSPQFRQLVQLFADVEIQDLKVSLRLKVITYIHYKILNIYNLKNNLKLKLLAFWVI